jgi:lipopolysaccharide/colanic/teichoic acid biosynthesis glycosyltransferase
MKRLFDLFFSIVFITVFAPLFLCIAILIKFDDGGAVFFRQLRVGKNSLPFYLWKFRTMKPNSESSGQITVGARDLRITRIGFYLRKYKIDELPQMWNIVLGDMSVVGPRPEVPKYVALYAESDKIVLSIRPGLTDYASLDYFSENELLAASSDPERTYREEIMPAKLKLNKRYIQEMSLRTDLKIIVRTVQAIIK